MSVNPVSLPKVTLFPAFGNIITHFQALHHIIFPLLRTKNIYFYPDSPKGKPKNNPTQKTNQTKNHHKTPQIPEQPAPNFLSEWLMAVGDLLLYWESFDRQRIRQVTSYAIRSEWLNTEVFALPSPSSVNSDS